MEFADKVILSMVVVCWAVFFYGVMFHGAGSDE